RPGVYVPYDGAPLSQRYAYQTGGVLYFGGSARQLYLMDYLHPPDRAERFGYPPPPPPLPRPPPRDAPPPPPASYYPPRPPRPPPPLPPAPPPPSLSRRRRGPPRGGGGGRPAGECSRRADAAPLSATGGLTPRR